MIKSVFTIIVFGIFFIFQQNASAQECECPGDSNGDYFVGANDVADFLGQMDCNQISDECSDFNQDLQIDVYDWMLLQEVSLQTCGGPEFITTPTSFTGLHCVLIEEFNAEFGSLEPIPAGSKTYRIYAYFNDPSERLLGVYGNQDAPLHLSSETEFYTSSTLSITSGSNEIFYDAIPEAEFRSYLANGGAEGEGDGTTDYWQMPCTQSPIDSLKQGKPLNVSSEDEFYWGRFIPFDNGNFGRDSQLQLIAQLTSTGNVSGQVNLCSSFGYNAHHFNLIEGLTFSSENLAIFGCMDMEALNYLPAATLNEGCVYAGDANADGQVNTEDLMVLLAQFGCSIDCGYTDVDGDGLTNTADLIFLLSLF